MKHEQELLSQLQNSRVKLYLSDNSALLVSRNANVKLNFTVEQKEFSATRQFMLHASTKNKDDELTTFLKCVRQCGSALTLLDAVNLRKLLSTVLKRRTLFVSVESVQVLHVYSESYSAKESGRL